MAEKMSVGAVQYFSQWLATLTADRYLCAGVLKLKWNFTFLKILMK